MPGDPQLRTQEAPILADEEHSGTPEAKCHNEGSILLSKWVMFDMLEAPQPHKGKDPPGQE